jgi:TonB family protein
LGVTLVEALTRIPPAWNRTGHIDPPLPPSVPAPFAQIARECLRLDPAHRCTLSEVWECLHSSTAIPHRPIKPRTTPKVVGGQFATRRNLALAGVALVLLIAIVSVVAHHKSPAPAPATSEETTGVPAQSAPEPQAAPPEQPPAPQAQAPAPAPVTAQPAQNPAPKQETPAQSAPIDGEPQHAAVPAAPAPVQTPPSAPAKTTPLVQATAGSSAKGAVAQQVMPDVPEKAIRTIQGKVKVSIQLNVDPSGAVSDASIASQGPSKYFANLALEAAKSWKFMPPQANGQGIASVWVLHFDFRQSGVDVTPTEQSP